MSECQCTIQGRLRADGSSSAQKALTLGTWKWITSGVWSRIARCSQKGKRGLIGVKSIFSHTGQRSSQGGSGTFASRPSE